MELFDKLMLVLLLSIIGFSSTAISNIASKEFTCEQFNKIYLQGECVALAKE